MAALIINTNAAKTASNHLKNALDSLSDGSSNSSEQDCEETLQADDAENAKRSLKRNIKRWCGYVVYWKSIYPNTELSDGELDPMDDLLQLDVGRVYLKIIQEDKGRKEFGFFHLWQAAAGAKLER